MNKINVVLASGSPRRKELLKNIFEDYDVITSSVDETVPDNITAENTPEYLAKIKATAVHNTLENKANTLTIGADTVVVCDGKIFGKPENEADAKIMLKALSGKTHKVITGCCLLFSDRVNTFSQVTNVSFYPLSDNEIDEYINTNEPFDKAGAYGIQGYGSLLVEKIDGDYFNVVGLPVSKLKREIENFIK